VRQVFCWKTFPSYSMPSDTLPRFSSTEAVPPRGWHVPDLIMKKMHRIVLFTLLGAAAFAQTDVPAAEKPPADVDQALRARVNEFYTMMVNHEYRKAEAWIAEETRDYYYAGPKPEVRHFEILSIEYSDHFTHATATTRCSQPLVIAGFPPGDISLKVPTLWKIENENWYLYEDPAKISNPSGLRGKIQAAVNTAASTAPPSGMPKEIPKDSGFVLGKVQADKQRIELAPGTAAPVTIGNGSDGAVTLELGYPLKGIEAKLDRTEVASGEKAVLTLTAGKEPRSGSFYLRVMPTGESIRIDVHVK
jgi:hypothetical protein